jgi:hypothetical protein
MRKKLTFKLLLSLVQTFLHVLATGHQSGSDGMSVGDFTSLHRSLRKEIIKK